MLQITNDERGFAAVMIAFALLIIFYRSGEVIRFYFFADKSKSWKRRYKKGHNIFYRGFFCYVFNKKESAESKFMPSVRKHYVFFLAMTVYSAALIAVLARPFKDCSTLTLDIFLVIYALMFAVYDIWYLAHLRGDGASIFRMLFMKGGLSKVAFYVPLPGVKGEGGKRKKEPRKPKLF